MISKILTKQSLTLIVEGKPYTIAREHVQFEPLLKAVNENDLKQVKSIIDVISGIKTWVSDNVHGVKVEVRGDCVYVDGEPLHNVISDRIMEWVSLQLDPQPLLNFIARIEENPSYQSRKELMLFLEENTLPIMPDGRFTAYKVVRSNYFDKYSGTFDNSVGQKPTMPRQMVNDDRSETCSAGLHFCSLGYVKSFQNHGDRLMLVAVCPSDVVSIPYDYNNAKGRCCSYEVIEDITDTENKYESKAIYG